MAVLYFIIIKNDALTQQMARRGRVLSCFYSNKLRKTLRAYSFLCEVIYKNLLLILTEFLRYDIGDVHTIKNKMHNRVL